MIKVFFSYRRKDVEVVDKFYYRLRAETSLTGENIFYDKESVPGGEKFPDKIIDSITRAEVVLVFIGEGWIQEFARREDNDDWVLHEIKEALDLDKFIIPVLVDDVRMPAREVFPETIQNLAYRNARRLRASREEFGNDARALIASIGKNITVDGIRPRAKSPRNIRGAEIWWNWRSCGIIFFVFLLIPIVSFVLFPVQADNLLYQIGLIPASDIPTATETPDTTSSSPVLTVNSLPQILTFRSSASFLPGEENNIEEVSIQFEETGTYQLRFANANESFGGYWMIWDYISLSDADSIIWIVGEDETPDVFDDTAFDEFCDVASNRCTNEYIVGTTEVEALVREINDNNITEMFIEFQVDDELVERDLVLTISTLYSSHEDIEVFELELSLSRN